MSGLVSMVEIVGVHRVGCHAHRVHGSHAAMDPAARRSKPQFPAQ